jgi:pyrroline-5-carboxylate reductase
MARIAFIGGGNMATALIGGVVARGTSASDFVVVEPFAEQAARIAQRFPGIDVRPRASGGVFDGVDLLVLAVKPQQMREAIAPLAPVVQPLAAVLSVAAGIRIADLSRWLGGYARIMRAMPNTPALIGAGITGLYVPDGVPEAAQQLARTLLDSAGDVVVVSAEPMLDAVTGVSASGPAYVFYFLEAIERAATELGFEAADARRLAYATFDGAVRLARASDADPGALRAQVTSKGGTTARGIGVLEARAVGDAIVECVIAATGRARELGDEFGRE